MSYTRAGKYGPEGFFGTSGRLQPGVAVTVYEVGTTVLASLYVDAAKSDEAPNPVLVDGLGNLMFYAEPGEVDLFYRDVRLTVPVPIDPAEAAQDADLLGFLTQEQTDALYVSQRRVLFQGVTDIGAYLSPEGQTSTSSHALGNLHAIPIVVSSQMTFDRIGVDVVTAAAAGGVARLGIYADNGNGYPGALILEAGMIDTTTTGWKEITIDLPLAPGMYWLASVSQVATFTPRVIAGSHYPVSGNLDTSSRVDAPGCAWVQTGVNGALPAQFTAVKNASNGSRIMLRRAA